jgi:hypothetical protein
MTVTTITAEQARALIALRGGIASHVGHDSMATIATELLGVPVSMDRTPWNGEGEAIALHVNGRPPEGTILTREQIEALGLSWPFAQARSLSFDVIAVTTGPGAAASSRALAGQAEAALYASETTARLGGLTKAPILLQSTDPSSGGLRR